MTAAKLGSNLPQNQYVVKILLDLDSKGKIDAQLDPSTSPPPVLDLGDRVVFQVVPHPAAVGITHCSIQSLLVFEPNTAITRLQKGALVATWSLIKNTQGIAMTLSGIYLTIPTTRAEDQVTVLNGNVTEIGQTCFVTLVGLAQITDQQGQVRVGTWCLDPELVLQSGGPYLP